MEDHQIQETQETRGYEMDEDGVPIIPDSTGGTRRRCNAPNPMTHEPGALMLITKFYKAGTTELPSPKHAYAAHYCRECRKEAVHRGAAKRQNTMLVKHGKIPQTRLPSWDTLIKRAQSGRTFPVAELARQTGLPYGTLMAEVKSGRLGHVKVGDRYFISAPAFEAWMNSQGFPT